MLESFWGTLLLGTCRILRTRKPSAQSNPPVIGNVACFGAAFPDLLCLPSMESVFLNGMCLHGLHQIRSKPPAPHHAPL